MGGLRNICRMYGGMKIQGVDWVWDYAREEPVRKSDMTKEQWVASERAKYAKIVAASAIDEAAEGSRAPG